MACNLTDGLRLTWDSHLSTMTDFCKMLYDTNYVSDVTISVHGGILRAHRIVLAMCSHYFLDLFNQQPGNEPILILPDIKYEEMKWLLEFMYLGSVKICRNDIDVLMKVAEKLQIKGLFNDIKSQDDLQPPTIDTLRGFDMPMPPMPPIHKLSQFPPHSQVQSMLSSAFPLNPALSLANSIPLQNLMTLSQSMCNSPLAPSFPKLNSPMKLQRSPPNIYNHTAKKRKRRNSQTVCVDSDASGSPTEKIEVEMVNPPAVSTGAFNGDDEPKDLSTNRQARRFPTKFALMDDELQSAMKTEEQHSSLPPSLSTHYSNSIVPLVIDQSPEHLSSNGTNLDKESTSPSFPRPPSSHSGEPSFSSNNSECGSPLLNKTKYGITEDVPASDITNDRVNTIAESLAGPSTLDNSDNRVAAHYFTALMSAAGMGFMPSPLPPLSADLQMLQHNQGLIGPQFEKTSETRRRRNKNSDKKYYCDPCDRAYASSGNLKRHKKYECGVAPQFSCPMCCKLFQHRHSVKIHIVSAHKAEANFILEEAEKNPASLSREANITDTLTASEPTPSTVDIQQPTQAEALQGITTPQTVHTGAGAGT